MKFYDTNIIINNYSNLDKENFIISSVTLEELENIKTNRNKTDDIKYRARQATKWLLEHEENYNVVIYQSVHENIINEHQLELSPDTKICACAEFSKGFVPQGDELIFVTDDIACGVIAKNIFGLKVEKYQSEDQNTNYPGFLEIYPTDEQLAYLYEHQNENIYNLCINEYLIIYNSNDEVIDALRWDGQQYQVLYKKAIKSLYFEKLKCKDIYQQCAIDSLMSNTLTAISGKAGSGKSLLSLMAAMRLIEDGKYDRIVILFNPTKARGASDLGFYSGDALEKAMQNSIGQILTTKFGDRYAVDLLMQQNRLKLVSMADCRGMEISDSEILWITEAQNTSVDLIKLALSRVSSGAKVFIEGDYTSQVDSNSFEGVNNGLKRVIDVFKGKEEFGYIQLQNVWRSKIAELCELL